MKINRKKLLFYTTYIPAFSLIVFLIAASVAIYIPLNETTEAFRRNLRLMSGFICMYMHLILAILFTQYLLHMEKPYRRLLLWWCLTLFFPLAVCPILYRRHRREFEYMLRD